MIGEIIDVEEEPADPRFGRPRPPQFVGMVWDEEAQMPRPEHQPRSPEPIWQQADEGDELSIVDLLRKAGAKALRVLAKKIDTKR